MLHQVLLQADHLRLWYDRAVLLDLPLPLHHCHPRRRVLRYPLLLQHILGKGAEPCEIVVSCPGTLSRLHPQMLKEVLDGVPPELVRIDELVPALISPGAEDIHIGDIPVEGLDTEDVLLRQFLKVPEIMIYHLIKEDILLRSQLRLEGVPSFEEFFIDLLDHLICIHPAECHRLARLDRHPLPVHLLDVWIIRIELDEPPLPGHELRRGVA